MSPVLIRLDQVSKSYDAGRTWAVRAVDLQVDEGELMVLLGESGCGKTTTLKMINRLIDPTKGALAVEGEPTDRIDPIALRRRIGYVFQGVGLFAHLTIAENIAVVPRLLGWSPQATRERVDELLAVMDLPAEEYRDRWPHELSGGQSQRIGVARALAARPSIMLMDEPFGALDPLTRDRLQGEDRQLHERLGLSSVMVTHDMHEALLLADRIAVMRAGEVLQVAQPSQLMRDPADAYVAALMRSPRDQADRIEALAEGAG